jgi:hypothetical protein
VRDFENFQAMVNKALVLENSRGILERRRKQERQSQHSTNTTRRIGSSSVGPIFHNTQQNVQPMLQPTGQEFVTPQRQMISRPNSYQTLNTRNQSVKKDSSQSECDPNPTGQEMLQLWTEGSLCYCRPHYTFTPSSDTDI